MQIDYAMFVLQNSPPSFSFSLPCVHISLQTYLAEVDHMRTCDHNIYTPVITVTVENV